MRQAVILGAGGHAREALDVIQACTAAGTERSEVLGFLADGAEPGTLLHGLPILGGIDWLADHPGVRAICAIGDPAARRRVARRAAGFGARFQNLIHPTAQLTRWVEMGEGCLVTAGCVLTNNLQLGDHVHVNLATTISHDAVIDAFATLAPGVHLAGNVTLGEGCNLGIGAVVIPQRHVGMGAVIGAGAVVTTDIPANSVAVGVPARVIRESVPAWHAND